VALKLVKKLPPGSRGIKVIKIEINIDESKMFLLL
jgi:hypothetical protein